MGQYVDFYCNNNNKELKKIVTPILLYKFGWLAQKDYDDFYSIASQVVWDCEQKFDGKKVKTKKFKSFVSTCIHNKIKTHITYINRDKRMVKDEDGNPLHNSSLDAPINNEDNSTIGDYIDGEFCVEDEVIGNSNEKVECCLEALSSIQRKIIELKMEGVSVEEVKQQLNLSNSEYESHMKAIKENRTVIDFKAKRNKNTKKEEVKIMDKTVNEETIQVMDIDTTDSYRRDNNTLGSLLDDISDELSPTYINRDYISQRQPFMWSEEQINKFYARILNNQPIPEIIVCEQVVDEQKISFLIDGLQRLSYAELFKNNIRPVKAKGAEFTHIKYKKRVVDENGNIKVVEELFDIVGKKYEDLPEFLQKRFDSFNVSVTRFFNCTPEMIDYHIRNYNSHTAMNKVQYSATNASNVTIGNIKKLSQKHSFFKDIVKINNKNIKDGSWDEVVGRAIMTTYFLDDWKREVKDVFMFLDENSKTEQFETLKKHLDRLVEMIGDNSLKELFTTGNTHIWLAVYDKFTKLGVDDSKFVDFMRSFVKEIHKKDEDATDFVKNTYKSRQSRDKSVIVGKIDGLYELLCEFLHINKEDVEEINYKEFVKANVEDIIDSDIEEIQMVANNVSEEVDEDSWMISEQNYPSYLAIVGVAFRKEEEDKLKEWLPIYVKANQFIRNQQKAFLHMKESFEMYLKKGAVA
jgi:DNA-directed RNA polymerase specialized sigma24 family protein